MSAMWLYLKENVKCGTKLSDVLNGVPETCRNRKSMNVKCGTKLSDVLNGVPETCRNRKSMNVKCETKLSDVLNGVPETCRNRKSMSSAEENLVLDSQLVHPFATPIRELIFRQNYSQTRLYEMEIGDPSRKIIEIIFKKASMDPARPASSRIKSVLRVKNSIQTLERFEKHREKVKMIAYEGYRKHPRSMVDGNELLKFYGTTMACRSQRSKRVSELCKNPTCRVCRTLQSHFGIEHALSVGIQLSSSSEDFSKNVIPFTKMKNTERAVIVCRTIAGSLVNVNNGECNEYDSIGNQNYNSGNVIVCNPSAVLPCFVIVFN